MKIKFLPQNIEVEGTPDKSLLQIATENHLEIHSICKGVPSCAECRVRIVSGDNNVLPPNKTELALIGTSYFIDGRRLSCQVRCFGDVTVDLAEQVAREGSQTKKIRGFRSNKQVESTAVNDTMLLTEKPDDREAEAPRQQQQQPPREGQPQKQNQPREDRPKQQQNQQRGGGGQNQQRQQQNPQQRSGGGPNPQKAQGAGGGGGRRNNRGGNAGGNPNAGGENRGQQQSQQRNQNNAKKPN